MTIFKDIMKAADRVHEIEKVHFSEDGKELKVVCECTKGYSWSIGGFGYGFPTPGEPCKKCGYIPWYMEVKHEG